MRTIQRNVAPGCLAKQPKNQDWGIFMGTPCHVTVGAVLREEQLGLCCYCESEVADSEGHIEHMEPRSRKQSRTYDFTNMAISCDGSGVEHCGRYKDDRSKNPICAWDATLFSDPHDLATASLFSYSTIGRIATTTADTAKGPFTAIVAIAEGIAGVSRATKVSANFKCSELYCSSEVPRHVPRHLFLSSRGRC